ncbi:ABC transporter permease [Pseudomonas fluorescens]|uniref:Aliphatic sulfonates transport permease protein SsuC n=1 Tax=Pseudomonas fluorescens TaxID=294 RepID=A0A5E7EJJ3_PSEFL|nr:ABC transporter permease [Pseudomonas fluorescens]VVO27065.1 Putative aliphatic sulfonates transport permease protein SsuC [Pseudomonas fluorescens]
MTTTSSKRPTDLRGWVVPGALVILWWLATDRQWVDTRIVASPQAVIDSAWLAASNGELWRNLSASLQRNLIGFAVGGLLGLLFGGWLGLSRLADRLLGPTFHTLKQIALFAWIPLLSVWFGFGEPAKVAFIALAVFYPVALNSFEGIRSTRQELLEVAQALGLTPWQKLCRLILPCAAPAIFTGLHLGLIYAWLATIGAEYFFSAGPGIGNTMIDGREHFQMDQVIYGLVVVGSVGLLLNRLARWVESRTLHWRTSH